MSCLQANDNGISEAFKQHADRVGLIEMTTIKEMENDKVKQEVQ